MFNEKALLIKQARLQEVDIFSNPYMEINGVSNNIENEKQLINFKFDYLCHTVNGALNELTENDILGFRIRKPENMHNKQRLKQRWNNNNNNNNNSYKIR